MNWRITVLLYLLSLAVLLSVASVQAAPGYMDADYYYATGTRLAQGAGFSEPFLWNYLDDPAGIPHPSHAYWMPLASLLSAAGMWAARQVDFSAARLAFVLLAAAVPPATAWMAWSFTRSRSAAVLAGLLAAAPAFYLAFLPTTDTFGLYMLLGAAFLQTAAYLPGGWGQAAPQARPENGRLALAAPFVLGVLAGLMHLARADGILWLATGLILVLSPLVVGSHGVVKRPVPVRVGARLFSIPLPSSLSGAGLLLGGYLLIMGPWFWRNLQVFGLPLSPSGGRALWVVEYDELYLYPASQLTAAHWWSAGLPALLHARWEALAANLQTALAVQGGIFLLPLVLLGLWRLRRDRRVQAGLMAWLLTFAAMTFAFPFAGARGGFFHSGAAVQPLFWSAVPVGLGVFIDWGRRRMGWNSPRAPFVFGALTLSLALGVAGFVTWGRVIGPDPAAPIWNFTHEKYRRLEAGLIALNAKPAAGVLVNNPPAYFLAASRPAMAIPYGDSSTAAAAAFEFEARYLLLEFNQLTGPDDLYANPGDRPGLRYHQTIEGTRIYEIDGTQPPAQR